MFGLLLVVAAVIAFCVLLQIVEIFIFIFIFFAILKHLLKGGRAAKAIMNACHIFVCAKYILFFWGYLELLLFISVFMARLGIFCIVSAFGYIYLFFAA